MCRLHHEACSSTARKGAAREQTPSALSLEIELLEHAGRAAAELPFSRGGVGRLVDSPGHHPLLGRQVRKWNCVWRLLTGSLCVLGCALRIPTHFRLAHAAPVHRITMNPSGSTFVCRGQESIIAPLQTAGHRLGSAHCLGPLSGAEHEPATPTVGRALHWVATRQNLATVTHTADSTPSQAAADTCTLKAVRWRPVAAVFADGKSPG